MVDHLPPIPAPSDRSKFVSSWPGCPESQRPTPLSTWTPLRRPGRDAARFFFGARVKNLTCEGQAPARRRRRDVWKPTLYLASINSYCSSVLCLDVAQTLKYMRKGSTKVVGHQVSAMVAKQLGAFHYEPPVQEKPDRKLFKSKTEKYTQLPRVMC